MSHADHLCFESVASGRGPFVLLPTRGMSDNPLLYLGAKDKYKNAHEVSSVAHQASIRIHFCSGLVVLSHTYPSSSTTLLLFEILINYTWL